MLRLLNPKRYLACRRVFHSPARAHVALSFLTRRLRRDVRHTLDFCRGGSLEFPTLGRWKQLFDLILTDPERFSPRADRGLLKFRFDGIPVALRPDSYDVSIFGEVVLHDAYGANRIASPLGTVIDLGANAGLFTTRIAPHAERVIAVEPISENRRVAAVNIRDAGFEDRVVLLGRAMAGESGRTTRIYLCAFNTGQHSASLDLAVGVGDDVLYEEVETLSLEDLFERERIGRCGLLKCDIEGAEYDMLLSTPLEVLRRIDAIVMEIHITPRDYPLKLFYRLRSHLQAAGFNVHHPPVRDVGDRPWVVWPLQASR